MRILILANLDIGLYKFRKELIEEFLRQKHEVYISLPNGNLIQQLEKLGCVFIDTFVDRRGINPKDDYRLFKCYRKMMNVINPDLVITYTIKPNIYGGLAARIAKKTYAVNITGLGTAFEKPGFLRSLVVKMYRLSLKKAKVVFFENCKNRDEMVSFRCCNKNMTVVLNGAGVNIDYYAYQPYPNNDIFRFLFVGRVMREKGVDELFDAMKRLHGDFVKCFLDIVGPFEEDYKVQLEEYESEGWLKYHGFQEDVRPFISACDCFILPSYHEGMANTNLESACSGRPIITSNIPGCKEAVINGKSGFLCEPRDSDSLYRVMKKMVKLTVCQRKEMGIIGREHMIDIFDKKKVVHDTISFLFK